MIPLAPASGERFSDAQMAVVRRAYARQMLAVAGVREDPRLEDAFAAVPREAFLGPGPWRQSGGLGGYVELPSNDPVIVYQDSLIALAPERGVNNGSPSLHAAWMHALQLRPGERVAHLGAGTGYYTALLGRLVGPTGRIDAVEFDPRLAAAARANLAGVPAVRVVRGDASRWPRGEVDAIYVNFAVERPAPAWLDRLRLGGRLIFPLGVPAAGSSLLRHSAHGIALLVTRVGEAAFSARSLGPAYFICADGDADAVHGSARDRERLARAFEGGGAASVRSLRWRKPPSAGRSWFVGDDWSLSSEEPG